MDDVNILSILWVAILVALINISIFLSIKKIKNKKKDNVKFSALVVQNTHSNCSYQIFENMTNCIPMYLFRNLHILTNNISHSQIYEFYNKTSIPSCMSKIYLSTSSNHTLGSIGIFLCLDRSTPISITNCAYVFSKTKSLLSCNDQP